MRMAWIAVPVIGLAVGVGALAWSDSDGSPARADTYRQLELFADVLARVQSEYVTEVDNPKAIEAALNGMLTSLDPHSSYMSPDEFRDMSVQTRGEYGGLGIEVTTEDGIVRVVSPIDDTPASKAGIQAGDYITHINDEAIVGLTLNDAVKKMRGAVGTPITITIAREGTDPFDVSLTREIIAVRAVTSRMEGDVGVIRVSTFNERTGAALEDAIRDVRRLGGAALKGVVIDLRNNPGGLLDQANRVSDAFLDGGEITSTRGRQPNDIQRYNARRGDMLEGIPVAVLINGGSASASEIVAGALQDHRRAILLGTKSFGKGSVQTIRPVGNQGAIRLTTARYYTPSGRSIQAQGIEPDIAVEQARIEVTPTGPVRREADLRGALRNPQTPANGQAPAAPAAPQAAPAPQSDEPPAEGAQDYQLSRALDLLRGLALFQQRAN